MHRLSLSFILLLGCGSARVDEDGREELLSALDRGEAREVVVVQAGALPIIGARVSDRAELFALEARSDVVHVEPNRLHEASATTSLELIGQDIAFSRGATGEGMAVAVLDTGLDFTRPEFGACTDTGTPAACAVPFVADFAPEDGARDDEVRHGTNVAAIVRAVAPKVKVIGLDVFDGSTASTLDIVAAIDWVLANRSAYNIVSLNLSLGYGAFTSPCPNDALAVALQRVRDAGIVPVVAAGNAGKSNALSSPACGPAAVSVGAVDAGGEVASFSNSASFLSLLAPGVSITGGGVTMSGTSQATPHVAGAVAGLLNLFPSDDPAALVRRLSSTGVATSDARNGTITPRIDLAAASVKPDVEPPAGLLTLSATVTRTPSIAYTLSANEAVAMCVSTAEKCTAFVPFAPKGFLALPGGDGLKTVRVWLRDAAANESAQPLEATVMLDTQAPIDGVISVTRSVGETSLAFVGFSDVVSGVQRYKVVYTTSSKPPASCAGGTVLGETSASQIAHAGLTLGVTYRYRVCAADAAGNMSDGAEVSVLAAPEIQPPQNARIVIAGGAAWTSTTAVQASLFASDASGVEAVCLSATTSCTAFRPMAAQVELSLQEGVGLRTVNAWFRDVYGNVSSAQVSATIRIDTVPPPNVQVQVQGSELAFAQVSEPAGNSGVSDYLVSSGIERIPASCEGGQVISNAGSGLRRVLLPQGHTAWRVCTRDRAGNLSSGETGFAR